MMIWYQLNIKNCPNESLDALSASLEEQGALSIILTDKNDDPILEPELGTTPLWPEVILQAIFDDAEKASLAKEQIMSSHASFECMLEKLPDEDWEKAWMDDFKPMQFGEKLWICPSWITPPDPNAINLILDPGLAFGTGTHPTTGLCLTWLEQAELRDKSVVDFGCGSGILALAALKLGAEQLFAIDIDPQALQATRDNGRQNNISEKQLICGDADILQEGQDIIIANILLKPLLSLYPLFHQLLLPSGKLVVSGLLRDQVPTMIEACQSLFEHEQTVFQDDWALIAFKRK